MKTVVVGISGGVDSSVVALLLKEAGYKVIALFMKNWEEDDQWCTAEADYEDVACVCAKLKIPFYTVNFAKEYWERVFSLCLKGYESGYTPNPDILCNKEIKFRLLLQKALEMGADYLATGHYCRKVMVDGLWHLARGYDMDKDQSYFLYTIKSEILNKVLFPVGELCKGEVRNLAERAGLVTAKKRDSTGICFIGERDFKPFLARFIEKKIGNFETTDGVVIGSHDGCAYYTIGQRRGLNIGGRGEAWYVVGKDVARNVVLVAQGEDNPALYRNELYVQELSWVASEPSFPLRCTAKIRYRSKDVSCTVHSGGHVCFDEKQKAVTAGQSIVFYNGEICLGGGVIVD